jgi:hypothetical protein
MAPLVSGEAVLYGRVVQIAAASQDSRRFPLLRGSGAKRLRERLAHRPLVHTSLFCLVGAHPARVEAADAVRLTARVKRWRLAASYSHPQQEADRRYAPSCLGQIHYDLDIRQLGHWPLAAVDPGAQGAERTRLLIL